ncbi:MAG: hypothetical protein MNPFHGCM_00483 [Gemmatimonadaceae bacterium]|nr:hypothetical protein [Gemmatimonadaceae bacterium]
MQVDERRRRGGCAASGSVRAAALVLTIVLALPWGIARTQEPAARSVTRLGDLYARVTRENARVKAAGAQVRAAHARTPGAKRPPDPQLQLGFMNYSLPSLTPMAPVGMVQLQLMQMVPLGGKLGLAGRSLAAQASAIEERARDVVWELRSQTAMAFYDLYAIDRQLSVSRETLLLLQDIKRTAESMYRVGEGRQADVLRAQVEIARMAEDTARMRAMRRTMVARIAALANDSTERDYDGPVRPQFPDTIPGKSWLVSLAIRERPMVRAGVQDVRAADAAAELARRELIPDLQIGAVYGQRRGTMTDTDASGEPMTRSATERMGSLMIGASIPIFARDRQLKMREESNAMRAMADADLVAMRAETRGRVDEAYASLMRARHLAALYRSTVLPQAEATVASAMSSYRVGRVDFMTLLDDQMTVNRYRQELFVLEADEGKAWADLEMLTARDLLDANSIATLSPVGGRDRNGGMAADAAQRGAQ